MGRTRLTYRDRVADARGNEWNAYRKALRADAQDRFDHLWDNAALYSMAGGSLNPPDYLEGLWMSMFLAQQREIDELREYVEELSGE